MKKNNSEQIFMAEFNGWMRNAFTALPLGLIEHAAADDGDSIREYMEYPPIIDADIADWLDYRNDADEIRADYVASGKKGETLPAYCLRKYQGDLEDNGLNEYPQRGLIWGVRAADDTEEFYAAALASGFGIICPCGDFANHCGFFRGFIFRPGIGYDFDENNFKPLFIKYHVSRDGCKKTLLYKIAKELGLV